jgi:predicted GIY-YIG superfamily endonuclease
VQLVYAEACPDRGAALKREYAIKQLERADKTALAATWDGVIPVPDLSIEQEKNI